MVRNGRVLAALPLVLVTTAALLLAAVPSPASAAELVVNDRRGDTTHPADILRVRVEHGDRIVVVVTHRNLTFSDGPAQVRVAYDTGSRYVGPEFYLRVRFQSDESPELRAAQGWSDLRSPPIATCTGEHVRVRPGLDRTRISVPRSCFGDPRRVRVHVRMTPFDDDYRAADVAPAARTMGPWVSF
jgi:hypothetical protein